MTLSGSPGSDPRPSSLLDPSVAENMFAEVSAVWDRLTGLRPDMLAVNFGLTALVVAVAAGVVVLLRKLLGAGLDRLAAKGLIHPEAAEGKPRVARATWLLIRLLVLAAALAAILTIWGIDTLGWLTAGSGVVVLRGLLIVGVSLAAIEVLGHLLDHGLHRAANAAHDPRRAQQVRTLSPLIRATVTGFVVTAAGLTLLSELGVQIAPLLASAGVLGIAVGFGAQTLVKDFLTGLFLVVEDIVAIGDNVRIGDSSGTVEAMTLRTIRLRNMNGTLHIFPYSEAQVIHNRTKTFSSYLFDISVGYDVDLDRAIAVMEEVGAKLEADPMFADKILSPLEVFGVDALGESAVVLKARYKTAPQEQWRVGRAYNKRIKEAFDEAGIDLPFPTRTVNVNWAQGQGPGERDRGETRRVEDARPSAGFLKRAAR